MNHIKHLIEPDDLTIEEINELIDTGLDIYENPGKYSERAKGKIMASLFFEPSTRTKFSFDSAMMRLGGNIIGFSDASTSSSSKGESLADTIKVMSFYADIIVMRHPKEGAPKLASEHSEVPIINGGDGGHQHPTQTLTDLITIQKYKGTLSGHKIGLCGDLKFGRTVHSLIKTLCKYPDNEFVLISPKDLQLPNSVKWLLTNKYKVTFKEVELLEDVIDELDVLYMTRIQRERFFNEEDYIRLKNSYILDNEKIKNTKPDMMIMHPLPRVNEIAYEVDENPRAVYFEQSRLGIYVRMALILKLLGLGGK